MTLFLHYYPEKYHKFLQECFEKNQQRIKKKDKEEIEVPNKWVEKAKE